MVASGQWCLEGIEAERLTLNEDALWSGAPTDWDNPRAREILPEVRHFIFEERYEEADELCKQMQGPFTQSYMPLGNLLLEIEYQGEVSDYRREWCFIRECKTIQIRFPTS